MLWCCACFFMAWVIRIMHTIHFSFLKHWPWSVCMHVCIYVCIYMKCKVAWCQDHNKNYISDNYVHEWIVEWFVNFKHLFLLTVVPGNTWSTNYQVTWCLDHNKTYTYQWQLRPRVKCEMIYTRDDLLSLCDLRVKIVQGDKLPWRSQLSILNIYWPLPLFHS